MKNEKEKQRYSVEASARRFAKRIKRVEEKQKRLIDKLVYGQPSKADEWFLKQAIKSCSRQIQTYKNSILYGKKQSKGQQK